MVRRALIDPIDTTRQVRPTLRLLVAMLAACGPAHLRRTAEVTSPIGTAQAAGPANQATADTAKLPPMVLGVQTHFSQGWPSSTLGLAQQVARRCCGDPPPWAETEKVRRKLQPEHRRAGAGGGLRGRAAPAARRRWPAELRWLSDGGAVGFERGRATPASAA
jgi:hypothetical protein